MSLELAQSLPENLIVKCWGGIGGMPDINFYIEGHPDLFDHEMSYLAFTRILQAYLYPEGETPTEDGYIVEEVVTPLGNSIYLKGRDKKPIICFDLSDFFCVTHYIFHNTNLSLGDARLRFINWLSEQPVPHTEERKALWQWLTKVNVVEGWRCYNGKEEIATVRLEATQPLNLPT